MFHLRNLFFVFALVGFSFLSFTANAAFPIQFDVGAYNGSQNRWDIAGNTGALVGNQTINLNQGVYFVRIGQSNTGGFTIAVDASGNVTSQNTAAATGSGNTLTFNTSTLNVNVGAYNSSANRWDIFFTSGNQTGSQALTVVPGVSYFVRIGQSNTGGFTIDVDASGNVTSQNTAAATGSGNTLTFNTSTLNVNVGAYNSSANRWDIFFTSGNQTGSQALTVVPGVSYFVRIGQSNTGGFTIDVDASGNVTSQNTAAATGSGNTLTFNTSTLNVNVGAYNSSANRWDIFFTSGNQTGSQALTVVPGVSYFVRIGQSNTGGFTIAVDASGNVTSQNTAAATGSGNTLTFNTSTLNVNVGAYNSSANRWDIFFTSGNQTGSQALTVVPGVSYFVRIGQSNLGGFTIAVDASGNVTSQNTAAATGSGNFLTFNTTVIQISPSPVATWNLFSATPAITGSASVLLVPGVGYTLQSGSNANFIVADPCAVNPNQIAIGGSTFDISCGALDGDNDGVPDNTDNCPSDANPDQIDQDLDGFGNVCDPDLDGDTIANMQDNCPDIANADQADADTDNVGDVCDGDDDNDSVADTDDNCPFDPNTDQANNDNDALGDVCDDDDDNDTVVDLLDNCPLDSNTDQADFDGNGEGDVCDGDIDNDGVVNATDLCSLTPQNEMVNADGCSGAQFIALSCVRENFAQHGQYVSCVAHAANDAVDQSLITPKEKSRFVREAAKK